MSNLNLISAMEEFLETFRRFGVYPVYKCEDCDSFHGIDNYEVYQYVIRLYGDDDDSISGTSEIR